MRRNIGYLVHPSITNRLSESPTIADIGTGTGAFLLQLAKVYPKATLRGFDVSQRLFPSPESLPVNVQLGFMNFKEPPPPEEQNRYDLVHVRLVTVSMDPGDWNPVVRNLTLLLKPGGALQWEEGNFADFQYRRAAMDLSLSASRSIASYFREANWENISAGWSTLAQIMRNLGFLDVDEDIVSSDRIAETRQALTTNTTGAIFRYARLMSERGAPASLQMDELNRLEVQAGEEIRSGCYCRYDVHVALGFKPERQL